MKFAGVHDRGDAERLKGALFVTTEELRGLESSEFWHHEIVGCRVVDNAGRELGVVTDVASGVAQDLLVVATEGGERFIPMVAEIVTSIDTASKWIAIEPPEGLLE